ncbi:purine-nucleoside phosphorylase, partial [Arthrospira platensis SPKY1]|nr:purine-nucleoside phosphorylase [Arthrospira platensis SPKY1]
VGGTRVACFQGRFHYYEGHSMQTVTLPVRAMAALGVGKLLVTNAAGGIRADLVPGSLMLISDHINAMGDHPLRGPNEDALGPRFPDMSAAYDPQLRSALKSKAAQKGITLAEGVYL